MSSKVWQKAEAYPLIKDETICGKRNKIIDDINEWSDQELDDLFQSPIEEVLDSMRYRSSAQISRKQCFRSVLYLSLISFVFGLSFATILITGYQSVVDNNNINYLKILSSVHSMSLSERNDRIDRIRNNLFESISGETIAEKLKNLTEEPITGETYLDTNTLFVYNKWKQLGLNTSFANYTVLMSYQMLDKPNLVSRLNKSGDIVHNSSQFEDPLNARPDVAKYYRLNPPYLAYSKSTNGTPLTGIPVYVNYGRAEDYDYLKTLNISVSGNVVIVRYGQIYRGNIVKLAEDYGAIGAIIYSDPYDYSDGNPNNTYPNSVYLPKTGVQRGTVMLNDGDPQTPSYPSIESAYRLHINESIIPKIPVQSISYGDAKYIMEGLKGPAAPSNWTGKLDIAYNIGPGYEDESYVSLEVNTYLKQSTIHNVIGVIKGCTEPDRYVLVGNHRDAWTFGAVDPLSGTAALLELSEAFSAVMKSQDWCPRRSIVFCSWAAEEYGLIGSTEWVEENVKLLGSQAIAYLNVDTAVAGNYTFQANGVPLLYHTIWDATKAVSNPNAQEVKDGKKTVFDSYKEHRPSKWASINVPEIGVPDSGSDQNPFLQIGVPVVDMYFDCNKTHIKCYPLYHSMYETYDLMANLTDREFKYSKALTQIWAEMLRSLSDTPLLPLSGSLRYYYYFLSHSFNELNESKYSDILREHDISLNFLSEAINEFETTINWFIKQMTQIDENDPLALRRVNDIMMYLERAFIDNNGFPLRKQYKHIVLAPSSLDSYSGSSFAGLYDLLWTYRHEMDETNKLKLKHEISKHISVITFHINSAKLLLNQTFHNSKD